MSNEEAEDRIYKWEIEPHPYDKDFDIYVTDDDEEARDAIAHLAEMTWDAIDVGEEKVIKVRHNVIAPPIESGAEQGK